MTAFVYMVYGEEDLWAYHDLPDYRPMLYIGSTGNITRRLKEHEKNSAWWYLMDRIELEACADREDAYSFERYLIAKRSPIYNKTLGGTW
jgi:predicted GIY-YIG superfamily endonuclease